MTRCLSVNPDASRTRWVGAFLVLAVTCLLSLIPLKVPALNPFWHDEIFPAAAVEAPATTLQFEAVEEASDWSLASSRLVPPSPLSVHAGDRVTFDAFLIQATPLLFAGIRANARIPAKRVRQIALPPPTPFRLRAPPERA